MIIPYDEKTDYYARVAPNGRIAKYGHKDYFGAYITPKGELLDAEKLRYLAPPFETIYFYGGMFDEFITNDVCGLDRIPEYMKKRIREKLLENIEDFEYKKEIYEGKHEKRRLDYIRSKIDFKVLTQMAQLEIDLCNLFIKCYNSNQVTTTTGKMNGRNETYFDLTEVLGLPIIFDVEYIQYSNEGYYKNKTNELLLKEILVSHLGYHSVESNCYKTITTSSWNIYEKFYNYLLMDYSIQQISRFYYDKEKEIYVERPLIEEHFYNEKDEQGNIIDTKSVYMNIRDYLTSDRELRLKDEIQAIKKLVPINERSKYFR